MRGAVPFCLRAGRKVRWIVALLLAWPFIISGAELTLQDGRPFCRAYSCDKLLPEAEAFRASARAGLRHGA